MAIPDQLEQEELELLPTKQRQAVKQYLKDPEGLSNKQYSNIYHNLFRLNIEKSKQKIEKIEAKIKFAKFFKKIKFAKPS